MHSTGDLRAHSVPAGEIKRSPLHAFSLLLAPKPLPHPLPGSAPTYPPPGGKFHPAPASVQPATPGAPPLLQPFAGSSPLSPADTHGSQTCGSLPAGLSRTPEALVMWNRAQPHTHLPVGTRAPWHQGRPSSLGEGLQAAGGGGLASPLAGHRSRSAQAQAEVDCQNCYKTPGPSTTVFGSPRRPQVQL